MAFNKNIFVKTSRKPRKSVASYLFNGEGNDLNLIDYLQTALTRGVLTVPSGSASGIYDGSGSSPDGTVVTAVGDLDFNRTHGSNNHYFNLGNISGVVPITRLYTVDATYGSAAVGVADFTAVANWPLMTLCGVNNTADDEESYFRGYYDATLSQWTTSLSTTALSTRDALIGIQATSVDGDSSVVISATASGSGSGSILMTSSTYKMTGVPAYDDDAAAGAGGLTAGNLYQTTGSGAAPLNVAGILVLKQ